MTLPEHEPSDQQLSSSAADSTRLEQMLFGEQLRLVSMAHGFRSEAAARESAEQALVQARARLEHLVTFSPATVYARMPGGQFEYVSPNAGVVVGLPADRLVVEREFWLRQVHPDDAARIGAEMQNALPDQVSTLEYRVVGMDSRTRFIRDDFRVVASSADTRWLVGSWIDVTTEWELQRELGRIRNRAQEEIGQELHDGVGGSIAGLSCIVSALRNLLADGDPSGAGALLNRLQTELVNTGHEISRIARGLFATSFDADALSAELDKLRERACSHGLQCELDMHAAPGQLDSITLQQLGRIAHEAVTNAIKHARASRLSVSLVADGNGFRLRVADDGHGLHQTAAEPEPGGLGLRIMTHRAASISATLRIQPGPDGGTVVTCWRSRRMESADSV